jgi:hypothetical protein
VQDNLIDPGSIAARMIWALDELFDRRFYMRITAAMPGTFHGRGGFYRYGSARRNCYPNDIISIKSESSRQAGR